MAGFNIPIAPTGARRQADGGNVAGAQDPLPLLKLLLDLKHRGEDQTREDDQKKAEWERETAKNFVPDMAAAQSFQNAGFTEGAQRLADRHKVGLPPAFQQPEVPGFAEPVVPRSRHAEDAHDRWTAKHDFDPSRAKAAQDRLDKNARRFEQEDRYQATLERAKEKERVRVREKMEAELQARENEMEKNEAAAAAATAAAETKKVDAAEAARKHTQGQIFSALLSKHPPGEPLGEVELKGYLAQAAAMSGNDEELLRAKMAEMADKF